MRRPVAPLGEDLLQRRRRTTRSGRRPRRRSAASGRGSRRRAGPRRRTSCGGRLSTTKKPRSSSSLAAVLRPAPVMPVTTTTSPPVVGSAPCGARLLSQDSSISPVAVFTLTVAAGLAARPATASAIAVGGPRRRCPGTSAISSTVAARSFFSEPNRLSRRLAAHLTEPGHVVEQALDHRLGPPRPVVGDREPVRLVADPLEQVEPLAGARQDHRVLLAGQPDLLEPLGQPAHRDVVDAELVERPLRGRDLRRPAVDDHQAGRVGELAAAGRSRGRPASGRSRRRRRPSANSPVSTRSSSSRRNRRVITSCIEATSFWPVDALDHEPAVLALAGQAVLEDHHRGDHLGALEVGDVVALDAQRRRRRSPSACWISSSARLRVVRSLARLVLCSASAWRGVAGHGLLQRLLVAALRHPDRDPAAAQLAEQLLEGRGCPSGSAGTRISRGIASPRLAGVQLEQEVARPARRCRRRRPVGHPAALAADPAAADVEDLHGDLERVLGERDHVGVGAVAEHHRLLLQRPLERADVVAQPGGPLEVQRRRRRRTSPSRCA